MEQFNDWGMMINLARDAWVIHHWFKKTRNSYVLDTKAEGIVDFLNFPNNRKWSIKSCRDLTAAMLESLEDIADIDKRYITKEDTSNTTKITVGMSIINAWLDKCGGDKTVLTVTDDDLFTVGENDYGVKTLEVFEAGELWVKQGDYKLEDIQQLGINIMNTLLDWTLKHNVEAQK